MTRLTAFFLAALVASITATFAENHFSLATVQSRGHTLELGLVRADGDGFVIVYKVRGGRANVLLGSEPVHAGTNSDVRVGLRSFSGGSALALLVVNGKAVASQRIRFQSD
ncbi:MAG TPA: hypothetical protein VM899_10545 [Rubellimicrobium sp.]|jgi:hypothetical protein|nr:hypothetical protein [Rubellimicrobium sp.]